MRLQEGKTQVIIIDFMDDYSHSSGYQKKNYLLRHAEERIRIYNKRKFPFKLFKVKL